MFRKNVEQNPKYFNIFHLLTTEKSIHTEVHLYIFENNKRILNKND